ncbi:ABC-type multidrug transport system fused ATPase/permease subunit [Lachnotalea glycerini]|uniref:ABC-type multidrug transport system fused ATPase/permease subunit n=1 Tax=Lachnotalea glycerini TaxID=1763509 RepID=A0A318ENV7_9FIRM|nr:ABC transporter ATP-binding protein [Lachnotalea glycerini]PXV91036.1 ABC-type multidrug transport system fused ATPase/permease subunit [Lachnotalea glycerini]
MIKRYVNFYKNYMMDFVRAHATGLLIVFIYSIISIVYPYFSKLIIDDAVTSKNLQKLWIYISTIVIFIVLSILLKYIKEIYFCNLEKKICLYLKNNIITSIFRCNISFFKDYKKDNIITILERDVPEMLVLFVSVFHDMFSNIVVLIGLIIILFILNWEIALFALIIADIYLILQNCFDNPIKSAAGLISRKRIEFQAFNNEMLEHITNIQLHNQIHYFKNKYDEKIIEYHKAQLEGTKVSSKYYVLDGVIDGANLTLLLGYGGYLVLKKELEIGTIFAMTLYIGKLLGTLIGLINNYEEIKKAQVSFDRICYILENNQYRIPSGDMRWNNDYTIHFLNVKFNYNQEFVVSNFNLEIKQGEKLGLIGDDKYKKFSLMNLLLKMHDYEEGNIYVGDNNIKNIDDSYYDKMLLISKEPFIFSGSILENLVMGAENITNAKVYEALSLVQLKNDVDAMKQGVDTIIGEGGIHLSEKQAQKLCLARIFLLNDYPIIILDEPGSAIDMEEENIVLKNIFRRKKDSTIIVITRREEILKYCNRMVEIKKGEINVTDHGGLGAVSV